MDIVSKSVRSRMMRNIQGKNTAPELIVRSAAHALGLRFRLHDKKLPGTPDLVLRRYRTAIFVHGCFWHRHGCALTAVPKTRTEFWMAKFEANQRRDARNREDLKDLGWRVLEIWECETRQPAVVRARLAEFFGLVVAAELLPAAGVSLPATAEQCAPPQQHRRHFRIL
ncbi:very short patch repair endonuclease [Ralstonia solanacearum]|uniref:Very short patch repair endonuclease n=1 Tax=Ralstonia solanacearum TaxID=305 RepID=A0AAW5ZNC1_RALSL|nr:very short patch repair endonuclease [Ralstonia solanacearum]MDB0571548.1 very short patch repair endonuclease [Ralstonia solanacearum]